MEVKIKDLLDVYHYEVSKNTKIRIEYIILKNIRC